MCFHSADYVLAAVTVTAAVFGLFGGFSGALGFCAGLIAAGVAVKFGHELAASMLHTEWAVALVTLVLALLAFGIARVLVKRVVKGLLAQPADALFGALVAAVTGAGVSLAAMFAADRLANMPVASVAYSLIMGFFGC